VRHREEGDLGKMGVPSLIERLEAEVATKA